MSKGICRRKTGKLPGVEDEDEETEATNQMEKNEGDVC
jgi:hypothetical protein